ncbi:MAG TPA: hypothetical protein VK524_21625, partial [Polyangiaceae bacterium]|nr:hypothetical protein [Polyangiaceae bacterium]
YATWLAVSELWTLQRVGGALRVQRWQVNGGSLASAGFVMDQAQPHETLASRFERAAARLSCSPPPCTDIPEEETIAPPGRPLWLVAGGVGAAGMLGSWILWSRYRAHDSNLRDMSTEHPRYADALEDRDTASTLAIVSTSAGSALFAAAAPFWLPERQRVPWWAWSAGAVGVASAGVGTVLWLGHGRFESCEDDVECARRSSLPLAPMLVTQGAALLSLPLTYLVRSWIDADSASVQLGVTPLGLQVGWSAAPGSF